LKSLQKCANNGNEIAMFHIGYAYLNGGWDLTIRFVKATEWFKKAASCGNGAGMAYYSYCLRHGYGVQINEELSDIWAQKALGKQLRRLIFNTQLKVCIGKQLRIFTQKITLRV